MKLAHLTNVVKTSGTKRLAALSSALGFILEIFFERKGVVHHNKKYQDAKMKLTDADLLNTHFKKSPSADIGNFSMDGDMLKLLLAIDARLPLSQVADKAGIRLKNLRPAVAKLTKLGLLEIAARKAPSVGTAFIGGLKANMVKAVGPFGEFVVQDALNATGYSEELPLNMAADLILQLSMEITDAAAQGQFKKEMIKLVS